MPLILSEKNRQFGSTYLWSVTEDESFFRDVLSETNLKMDHIQSWHPRRQKEWMSGRFMIHQFMGCDLGQLIVDKYGKPTLRDSRYHFSISHTGGIVGLMFHQGHIGLDLQIRTDKVYRTAHKFCSQNDYTILGIVCEKEEVELFTWSLKEAVFKAYGRGQLSYKHDILLRSLKSKPRSKEVEMEISKRNTTISYVGNVRMIGPYAFSQVREVDVTEVPMDS